MRRSGESIQRVGRTRAWLLLMLLGALSEACQGGSAPGGSGGGAGSASAGAAGGHAPGGAGDQAEAGAAPLEMPAAGAGEGPQAGGGSNQAQAGAGGMSSTDLGAAGDAGASSAGPTCHDGGPGEGATCASYCSAWFPLCKDLAATSNVYADHEDCLKKCAGFSLEQMCCRGYHVTNAPQNPNTHCAHAAGYRTCP